MRERSSESCGPTERKQLACYTLLADASPPGQNAALGRQVRTAYGKLLKARGAHAIHLHHVRAHTRVAGNELVDRLAKAAAADATVTGDGDLVRHLAEREYALAWANDPTRTTRHTQPNPNSQTSPPASPPPAHPIHFPAAAPGPPTQFNPPVAAHSLGIG